MNTARERVKIFLNIFGKTGGMSTQIKERKSIRERKRERTEPYQQLSE